MLWHERSEEIPPCVWCQKTYVMTFSIWLLACDPLWDSSSLQKHNKSVNGSMKRCDFNYLHLWCHSSFFFFYWQSLVNIYKNNNNTDLNSLQKIKKISIEYFGDHDQALLYLITMKWMNWKTTKGQTNEFPLGHVSCYPQINVVTS